MRKHGNFKHYLVFVTSICTNCRTGPYGEINPEYPLHITNYTIITTDHLFRQFTCLSSIDFVFAADRVIITQRNNHLNVMCNIIHGVIDFSIVCQLGNITQKGY